jgi:hypothetical protein
MWRSASTLPGSVRNRSKLPQQAGFENIDLSVKAMLYRSDPHEILLSAAITWVMGDTGNPAAGGGKPEILRPEIFYVNANRRPRSIYGSV